MLSVQKFLSENGIENGLKILEEKYSIKSNRCDTHFNLNYVQMFSPKFDPIVDECRGLILDYDLNVRARSFDRFYNFGENPNQLSIDLKDCTVWEKVDGSLIIIWWNPFKNEWNASTRKMLEAEGSTPLGNSFHDVIERISKKHFNGMSYKEKFEKDLNKYKNFTFIFEMVSKETRVVKLYEEEQLYLLSVRDNIVGYEFVNRIDWFSELLNVPTPMRYNFDKWDEFLEHVNNMESKYDEGFVCSCVIDNDVYRLKVKNPKYLKIAKLRNNGVLSIPMISKKIWDGEEDEYLCYFPDDREIFQPYINAREEIIKEVNELFNLYGDIENRKKFAEIVKETKYSDILFNLKNGYNLNDILNKMFDCRKEKLLISKVEEMKMEK